MKHIFNSLLFFLIALTSSISFGQKEKDILMTLNNEEISVNEFTRVYLKNINLVQDESQKDVATYLELFKDYKLKIQEAYALKLDDKKSYQRELAGYRNQLARNYMADVTVTEALIKEAYERSVEEVRARHILIKVPEGSSAADTLRLYNKINAARQRILAGEDFGKIARALSDDPSAKSNGGELGWFKAFKMVYAFEEAAYNSKTGDVSLPFRSRFGYHIVQTTDRRKSLGEVTAAHIMVSLTQKDSTVNPQERIKEIYSLLQQGEAFSKLARKYSDDKKSGKIGGKLNKFALGQLSSPIFERQVFALVEKGSYTKPFKTEFGWHIAQLLEKHPVGSYEQMRYELENKVKRDARAKIISDSLTARLLKRYNVDNVGEVALYFQKEIGDKISQDGWKMDAVMSQNYKTAFVLRDSLISYSMVGKYLEKQQPKAKAYVNAGLFIKEKVADFIESTVRKYHTANLEKEDADFNNLLTEYKEGLLLFDLMETKIWNQAKTDSVGLQKFYDANKGKYQWPERIDVTIGTSTDKQFAENGMRLFQKGQTADEVRTALNTQGKINIFCTSKIVAINDSTLPKDLAIKVGMSRLFEQDDYTFYAIKAVLPAAQKSLEEARGLIASDYQESLEKEWMDGLRAKAKIKVNKKVLKKLTQNLQMK